MANNMEGNGLSDPSRNLLIEMDRDDQAQFREELLEAISLGFGGVIEGGQIVDRRLFPHAIPLQQNKLMKVPEPINMET